MAPGWFNKEKVSEIQAQRPRFKAFLSPGDCFLSFQVLWLCNYLNIFRQERETPNTTLVVMFVYAQICILAICA